MDAAAVKAVALVVSVMKVRRSPSAADMLKLVAARRGALFSEKAEQAEIEAK
eukprot:CAMPEP_0116043744 /NCGR_PEP_ID=MMETSP0321-20121206/26577_1 /TAXON_ID=163516 /ORGANISM="Leptocylindrus danicus var. danicus, Strain B650" /LENGTH=51 /DNA_ID=CAMNT_0003524689 /DNA_START=130 /DNA_END=282 /DNA_ORIENTATION=+